ncbi:Gfo/Idh/MocA family protein [Domibacillus enclensis]|uniref:Oxidoreductase family, NAD-binding Rossmann fold n=1 Tax=Domibacillus enclensis TaxID=1017273 RepID=A0A1N6VBK6_9BACI|nr:Gfo/Idh/MocA family oxidoreductase [Domibacillus enclensis]SIQ75215.1 Oxidoreductase family, NAD-binding Rossmann fold [Domibacillus enclensis]
MKRKFNVGLLGCGEISDIYFRTCSTFDIIQIKACASRNMEKAKSKAEKYQIPKACTIDELIHDPDLDIILNLTTPDVHAEMTLAALEAGKHVYSEKPLAANLRDAKKILDVAKEKGLRVGCAPDTFLGGRLQACREVIDNGIIGEPLGASAFVVYPGPEWIHPNPDFLFKEGAGPLLDIGPYYVTALISLLGPVVTCSGMAKKTYLKRTVPSKERQIDVEVPTHVTGSLQFKNGVLATLVTSYDV